MAKVEKNDFCTFNIIDYFTIWYIFCPYGQMKITVSSFDTLLILSVKGCVAMSS
jgi:hypothetical protein